ncbi:MAG: hypothetical protein KatS3mg035_2146 [Bacteroidia bacterium]|nr:MAG: hypothetical protein KatS3mg035_2146 [Bacteroidia bacterium]
MQIRWTDYGKVKEIDTLYQGNPSPNIPNSTPSAILPKLRFKYDATGNRLEKEYVLHYKDIYLRDPQGNVMAVYRIAKDSLFLTELPMYGEKRLGVIKENRFLMKKPTQNGMATPVIVTASKPPVKTSIYPLGKKALRNHRLARQCESHLHRQKELEQWQVCFEREQFARLLSVWSSNGGENV